MSITKQQLEEAIKATSSMSAAAAYMQIHFSTFKRHALKYDLYNTNQSGKGISKQRQDGEGKIPLKEILEGKHPQYQTFKLKKRLYQEGLKQNVCEECGISEHNNKPIECELDHIDGDKTNHLLKNLRVLCPNCHSQTHTFRFKRGKNNASMA